MKKLLVFIGIMLLTMNAFGQRILDKITNPSADYQFYHIGTQPYGFILNGNKFILSYDTLINKNMYDANGYHNPEFFKEVGKRPIYLFRYDGKQWVKASEPVQYDFCVYSNRTYYKKYYWCGEEVYKTGDPNGKQIEILNDNEISAIIYYMHQPENYLTIERIKIKIIW